MAAVVVVLLLVVVAAAADTVDIAAAGFLKEDAGPGIVGKKKRKNGV